MKKILLLSSISLLGLFNAQAQVLEFEHNPATLSTTGSGAEPFVTVYNTVNNMTTSNVKYKWTLINPSEIPSGWAYNGFCDNSTCYNAGTLIAWETGNPVECELPPSARSTDFKLQLEIPNTAPAAIGTFKFRVEVLEGGTQEDTIVFIVTKSTTSIDAIALDDARLSLYPNPSATGTINLYTARELKAKHLNVYNMLGQQISTHVLNQNAETHQIDIQNLQSGLHYIQVVDASNTIISTRNFIKQ